MGESSFVMAVGVSKLNDRPDNATKGTLRFNNATAMKTWLKKYKFGFFKSLSRLFLLILTLSNVHKPS